MEGLLISPPHFSQRTSNRPRQHEQRHFRRSHRGRAGKNQSRSGTGIESAELEPNSFMSTWSLPQLLAGLHDDIERRLETARKTFGHPGTKGDASEHVWIELLEKY